MCLWWRGMLGREKVIDLVNEHWFQHPSSRYPEGTIIIAMSYDNETNKIKVSARLAGRNGRNVREILNHALQNSGGGECGGHPKAAGCLVPKAKEQEFLKNVTKSLELEVVKI